VFKELRNKVLSDRYRVLWDQWRVHEHCYDKPQVPVLWT